MKIEIDIPKYDPDIGIQYHWTNSFEVDIRTVNEAVQISANKEGLLSLANHLLNLAQDEVPNGVHLHFDEYNSLEDGLLELIIQKR